MRCETLLFAVIMAGAVCLSAAERPSLSAVRAEQQRIGRDFADADLSPFTAVASRYFSTDETARLVVRGREASFEAASAPGGVADVHFDGKAIWVAPVAGGAPLTLTKKRGEDGVEEGKGEPLAASRQVGDQDVVRIGRYYLETGARPGYGRAVIYDPEAPMRKAFAGLRWFPATSAHQFQATYIPNGQPDRVTVTTSRGLEKEFYRVGAFSFEMGGRTLRLVALAPSATPKPGEDLFVAFRDATTGHESYAVGRYLNVPFKGAGAAYLLDFNLATNPYCAYSPHYNCVIPPKENTLPVAIRAGEMSYAKH